MDVFLEVNILNLNSLNKNRIFGASSDAAFHSTQEHEKALSKETGLGRNTKHPHGQI